jgi:AAA+ superfamily predicted ATPase
MIIIVDLWVDQIYEVGWNKIAFDNLVVDRDTKELIQALVMNQVEAERGTDVIGGKGNGLIMPLHGGPGTGKTFTAEAVAEIAEKPLYRVTCGDIGTKPEDAEKYLESALHLGNIWGCVVLLDEADVFLEERSLDQVERNALVSVFLRVLEHYEGILILTSNRVGTFDEAFKSRIQLALHYKNHSVGQRQRIWWNFLDHLRAMERGEKATIDIDDIRDHVSELANQFEMNGRQIRNVITTARQLAKHRKQIMNFSHLEHVINFSARFEKYLQDVKVGLTDDEMARQFEKR